MTEPKKVEFRDARDFVIWYKAWTDGKKKLTGAELDRLSEMVDAIPLTAASAAPRLVGGPVGAGQPKPALSAGTAQSAGP